MTASQLHGRTSDAACRTVNQDGLPGFELCALEQGLERCQECFGHGGGFGEAHAVRNRDGHAFVNHHPLRVATARQKRHHAVTHLDASDALAQTSHDTCAFEPEDRAGARRRSVDPASLQKVRAVQPGSLDVDQYPTAAEFGFGDLPEFQLLGATGFVDDNGLHPYDRYPMCARKQPVCESSGIGSRFVMHLPGRGSARGRARAPAPVCQSVVR